MTIDIPVSEQRVSDADVLAVVSGLENVRSDLFSLSRPAVSAIQGKAINLIERLCDELLRLRTAQPKGESGVTIPREIAECAKGMCENYREICLPTNDPRVTKSQTLVIDHLDAALRSPAACAASQETAGELPRHLLPLRWSGGTYTGSIEASDGVVIAYNIHSNIGPAIVAACNRPALRLDESKAQMTEEELEALDWAVAQATRKGDEQQAHAILACDIARETSHIARAKSFDRKATILRSLAKRLGEK